MTPKFLTVLAALTVMSCSSLPASFDPKVIIVHTDEAREVVCYSYDYYAYDRRAPLSCVKLSR